MTGKPKDINTLKHYLCRTLGSRDVVPEECTVRTMLLLLNCHRELFQGLIVESAFPQDTGKFSCQRPFVAFASEKRHRLAGLATTTCTNITISVRSPERRKHSRLRMCNETINSPARSTQRTPTRSHYQGFENIERTMKINSPVRPIR